MDRPFDREILAPIFARSEQRAFSGNVFRLTDDGIWLPTPLEVFESALDALHAIGFWERHGARPKLLDAGMGDGRLVACLCSLGTHVHACGIESHRSLYELSLQNLRGLPASNWSICRGNYLEPEAYDTLGVPAERVDVVFNYPDGNEEALVRFWKEHGRRGAYVVFLTPDQSLSFDGVELESLLTIERGFRLYLYRV